MTAWRRLRDWTEAGVWPQELGRAHLPDALRTLAERWSGEQEVVAQVEVTGTREPLSPAIEVSLFRVARESLTNVAKHAEATRVGVTCRTRAPRCCWTYATTAAVSRKGTAPASA